MTDEFSYQGEEKGYSVVLQTPEYSIYPIVRLFNTEETALYEVLHVILLSVPCQHNLEVPFSILDSREDLKHDGFLKFQTDDGSCQHKSVCQMTVNNRIVPFYKVGAFCDNCRSYVFQYRHRPHVYTRKKPTLEIKFSVHYPRILLGNYRDVIPKIYLRQTPEHKLVEA